MRIWEGLLDDGAITNYVAAGADQALLRNQRSAAFMIGNTPPVAHPADFTREAAQPLQIAFADLLAHATDVDGESLVLAGVSATTTNGINLATNNACVFYTNALNVADAFSYTVSDGHGGMATGLVRITVTNVPSQVTSLVLTETTASVMFSGAPGQAYDVRRSTNLTDWVVLVITNAPSDGRFLIDDNFSDLGGVPTQAFYQLAAPVP